MRLERRGFFFVVSLVVLAGLVALSMARPGRPPGPGRLPTGAPPTPPSAGEAPSSTTPISTPNLPPGADVTGTWSGTWASTTLSDAQGGISVTWTQDGPTLAGSMAMDGQDCLNGDVVRGTMSGLGIAFNVVQREATVDFSATVSGNSMSGAFSTDCDIGQGTWTMQKSP